MVRKITLTPDRAERRSELMFLTFGCHSWGCGFCRGCGNTDNASSCVGVLLLDDVGLTSYLLIRRRGGA
jgi:hypothetical protein